MSSIYPALKGHSQRAGSMALAIREWVHRLGVPFLVFNKGILVGIAVPYAES